MTEELKGFLAFLGFIGVLVPWCCGGIYQWARWGWAGQAAIHSMRKDLDRAVNESLRQEIKRSAEAGQ